MDIRHSFQRTNPMEQRPSSELGAARLVRIFQKPEGPLTRSQGSATGPYSEADESSPRRHALLHTW